MSRPFMGIDFIDRRYAIGVFDFGLGYVLRRTELSQALYQTAVEKENIQ